LKIEGLLPWNVADGVRPKFKPQAKRNGDGAAPKIAAIHGFYKTFTFIPERGTAAHPGTLPIIVAEESLMSV
jgi:hypothetical protein